jgi:hypothetical protein
VKEFTRLFPFRPIEIVPVGRLIVWGIQELPAEAHRIRTVLHAPAGL